MKKAVRKVINKSIIIISKPVLYISLLIFVSLCLIKPTVAEGKERSPEAYSLYNEAVVAYRTRHFTLAKQTFYTLIEKYPDDDITDTARINLANLLKDLKEYDKAIEIYKDIIQKARYESDKNSAKIQLVDILYSAHRYREGIELLEDWVKNNTSSYKSDELACKLAQFYLQVGNKDEAWFLLESHLEKGSKAAFNALLDISIKSGEIDKLLNTLENKRNRLRASMYVSFVADCYLAIGRKDKAIEAIKEHKYYVQDITLLRKISDIQISDNKIDDAIESLDKLMKLIPSDNQTNRKLGHCYFLKGDKKKALEIWRLPLKRPYGASQEVYMNYTTILIEHQLLEQALKAFEEARLILRNDTIFAEEKAAVLEALGRNKEAKEENLKVLSEGIYKQEIFDKLYTDKVDDFSLEKRLIDMNKGGYNQAIRQALIEFYFRKAKVNDIEKLVKLVDDESSIFFDDLFYDRLRQEALLVPEEFHFTLIKRVMESRRDSSLELKLAALILKMPEYNEKWQKEAYEYAKKTAESEVVADSELKVELYIKLAEFAFYYMKSPKEADKYLSLVMKRNIIVAPKSMILEAKLIRAMISTYMSDFSKSEKLLNEVADIIGNSDRDGGLSRLEQEEFLMYQKVELARLNTHMGKYQEALNSLNDIVENHKEGEWVNDGLELALDITRFSVGDFSVLEHKYNAKRLAASGQNNEAIEELDAAIKAAPASATSIIIDLEAEKLLLADSEAGFNKFLDEAKNFMVRYPECLKNSDIAGHKIKLMQQFNKSQDNIDEEMRTFIHNFPNDLRSAKYKQCLENGGIK